MDLSKVSKGITNTEPPKSEEDLLWCGFLDRYNDVYEKCSTRTPASLKAYKKKEFYPVSTTDDPVIEKVRALFFYNSWLDWMLVIWLLVMFNAQCSNVQCVVIFQIYCD